MTTTMLHEPPRAPKVPPPDWYESQENVLTLVSWLAEHDYFEPTYDDDSETRGIVRRVMYVVERPSKFTDEYRRMLNGLGYDEELCPECGAPGEAMDIKRDGRCMRCEDAALLAEAVNS